MLVEDFGDDTFTRLLAKGADETRLYELAIDMLADLHRLPAGKAFAGNQVADQHAVEPAERHADQGNDQRVADRRQALGEDHVIVPPGEGLVGAEGHDQRGVEQQGVEIEDHRRDEETRHGQRD